MTTTFSAYVQWNEEQVTRKLNRAQARTLAEKQGVPAHVRKGYAWIINPATAEAIGLSGDWPKDNYAEGEYALRFKEADLTGTHYSTDFSYADLRGRDLRGAGLCDANFSYADLRNADLRGANLDGANLDGADLRGAKLHKASLRKTNACDMYGDSAGQAAYCAHVSECAQKGGEITMKSPTRERRDAKKERDMKKRLAWIEKAEREGIL